jgi:chemotaxis protein MotB
MRTRPLLLLTLLLPLAACVSKKDHEALQKQLDQTRAALEGTEAERDRFEHSLIAERDALLAQQQHGVELEAKIADLEQQLATMERLRTEAEEELTNALASKSAMKASVNSMNIALAKLRRHQAAVERRLAEYKRLLERFKPLIDAGTLDVKIIDGRMVLVLPMDILFESGKAVVSAEGRESLLDIGERLATIPERKFQIEGHTDNVPIRTERYPDNWRLGSARALNVVDVLIEAGVKAKQISAASHGEHSPTAGNDSDEGRAKNRRIEIVIVPDLSDLPGFEELNEAASGSAGS